MLALPAFFNAHTHAAMTLERGWAEDLPFERWLNERIWVAESALEEEDVYWGAALAAAEMIRAGIVGFADHYFWMDQVLLRLATQAPAFALGFPSSGLLAPGRPADLLLFDTRLPHWLPSHDLAAGVVYTAHPGDIAYIWCDGQLLYRQGEFLTLDYERIRFEAEHPPSAWSENPCVPCASPPVQVELTLRPDEIELADLQSRGAYRRPSQRAPQQACLFANHLYICQRLNIRLREAQVFHREADLPVLD
jgi:hypothetical protein